MTDEAKWCWAYSEDDERWNGPHDSRDDAIGDAREHISDPFCVARCKYPDPADYVDFVDICERIDESAADHGCFSEDDAVFDISDVKGAEKALNEWARKFLKASYFSVDIATRETVE